MSKPITKPGKYGTLYLYRIEYTDRHDDCCGVLDQQSWAYNLEHAEEKFYDSCGDDDGWKIVSIARVSDAGSQHRAIKHAPLAR